MSEAVADNCLNCGVELVGPYCASCGQKVIEPKDRTLKNLLVQFLGSAFFLENNFFKNIWSLLIRPGLQPLDFIEGRRRRWMPPFSLFLLINLFYFWYSPLTDLNLGLREQMGQPHHACLAQYLVDKKLKSENITLEEYANRYRSKSSGYANSLIVLQIPIFALYLYFIFYRNQYFFVDHFMVSMYVFAFLLLTGLLLFRTVGQIPIIKQYGSILPLIYALMLIAYMAATFKRVYKRKWWAVSLLALPAFLCFMIAHFIYRTILFLIAYSVS